MKRVILLFTVIIILISSMLSCENISAEETEELYEKGYIDKEIDQTPDHG